MNSKTLKEIKERAAKATDGPWGVSDLPGCRPDLREIQVSHKGAAGFYQRLLTVGDAWSGETERLVALKDRAAFVAASRSDVPELCDEVHRLVGVLNQIASTDGDAPWHEKMARDAVKEYQP
jgi:hypothetical protein